MKKTAHHRRQSGTSLIEVMVSLAIGLLFGIGGQLSGFCFYRGLTERWSGRNGYKLQGFALALAVAGAKDGVWELDFHSEQIFMSARAQQIIANELTVGMLMAFMAYRGQFDSRALAGCLPLGHLDFDLGHFVSEPVVGEDMGVGE